MINEVEEGQKTMRSVLEPLIGKKFGCVSRAIDMLCLFIGDDYTFLSRGKEIPVSEFSIHFQTQWRFVSRNVIILGSRDIYEPYSRDVSDDWEYDIIGRRDAESSIFDVKARDLNLTMKNAVIVAATVSDYGDVRIDFSNGVTFQSFTPASYKREEWRLIDYKASKHTIVYDVEKKEEETPSLS